MENMFMAISCSNRCQPSVERFNRHRNSVSITFTVGTNESMLRFAQMNDTST